MPIILVDWRCTTCQRTGTAVAETTGAIERRVRNSHTAIQPHRIKDRCTNPLFEMTSRYAGATRRET